MSKKWLRDLGIQLGVVTIVAGATVGIIFGINSSKDNVFHVDSGMHEKINLIDDVEIAEYTIDGTDKYYLGLEGLALLKERILNEVGFGPEISSLKKIWINNRNLEGEGARGYYVGRTGEIWVTTDWTSEQKFHYTNNSENDLNTKVELVFQTLFHEYGHHFAYTYLSNEYPGSPDVSDKIYSNQYDVDAEGKGVSTSEGIERWNASFVDDFITHLNYDQPEGELTGNYSLDNSIANYVNQTDLFNFANSEDPGTLDELSGLKNVVMGATNGLNISFDTYEESLGYYYSMHELYTRKYMQLALVYDYASFGNNFITTIAESNRYSYGGNGNYIGMLKSDVGGKSGVTSTTFVEDTKFYQDKFYPSRFDEDDNVKEINGARYLNDAIFDQETYNTFKKEDADEVPMKMYESLMTSIGQKESVDLSFITPKNTSWLSGYIGGDLSATQGSKSDLNSVKFGGYLMDDENYKYVGVLNEDTNKWKTWNIITHDFNYKIKDELLSTERLDLLEDSGTMAYWTDDYINYSEIENEVLYFISDINEDGEPVEYRKFTGVKDDSNGRVTSFRDQYHSNDLFYYVSEEADGVQILKQTLHNETSNSKPTNTEYTQEIDVLYNYY